MTIKMLTEIDVPHSLEAEEAVIGAVLINPSAFIPIASFLKSADFYYLKLAYIWGAFERLTKRSDPIDYMTVIQELKAMGWLDEVGGPPEITRLVTQTPTSIHAEVYGHLVEKDSIRRNLLNMTDQIRGYALNTEIELTEVIDQSQSRFLEVLGRVIESRGEFIGTGIEQLLTEMESAATHPQHLVGIPTAYKALDELLGGVEKQDLIVLAARPGAGKSALCGCLALNMAKMGYKVGFFPNEMSKTEFYRRALAVETGIDSRLAKRGVLTQTQWKTTYETAAQIHDLPIYIDDKRYTPMQLQMKGKALQSNGALDVMLVDGLYRMPADSGADKRVDRFSELAEAMKNLSKDLDIPVIVTHQLSRECEKRQDKRPILSDLAESGRIEQEADQVWFIYRDVMYNDATEFPNQADIIVAKNRDGATGTIALYFEKTLTRFVDGNVRRVSLLDEMKEKHRQEKTVEPESVELTHYKQPTMEGMK